MKVLEKREEIAEYINNHLGEELIYEMTFYMHTISGHVATKEDWLADFESTDKEAWFGESLEECKDKDPFDVDHLVEVTKEDGEWVEV